MTRKKYSKYILLFSGIMLVIFGFYAYQSYEEKQIIKEAVIEEVEEKIPQNCENGEWIVFPDLENFLYASLASSAMILLLSITTSSLFNKIYFSKVYTLYPKVLLTCVSPTIVS